MCLPGVKGSPGKDLVETLGLVIFKAVSEVTAGVSIYTLDNIFSKVFIRTET
jgi:hypothetical protein